ncbi:MAG: prenyltransferase/squalene oxidase repeat-containing protein [Thermoleophilia bacterium]
MRRLLLVGLLLALLAASGAAPAGAAPPSPERAIAYLQARQQPDGGFAEPGGRSDPGLTAWVVLGLDAAGIDPAAVVRDGRSAADYLAGKPYPAATDLELRILALVALHRDVSGLADQLARLSRRTGSIGPTVNSTIWGILALRAAGRPVPAAAVRYLLGAQAANGGFSWFKGGAPDTNDTAAAVRALLAAGKPASARPIRRALAFLAANVRRDGGVPLEPGDPSDAQSTAWTIEAVRAAGRTPPRALAAYLGRLQRADGSFRFRAGRTLTPTWVTAYVLRAIAAPPGP